MAMGKWADTGGAGAEVETLRARAEACGPNLHS